MIVKLERGVWLCGGTYGDPPRTLVKENAKNYKSRREAVKALARARTWRPFKNASIEDSFCGES